MDINKYLVDADNVGDWGGRNQLAADNLNRIYQALHLRIGPVLIFGKEKQWDPELYDEIMSQVRGDWMNKSELLSLPDGQVDNYVESLAEIYGIPPVPTPKVDNVEIKEETEVAK